MTAATLVAALGSSLSAAIVFAEVVCAALLFAHGQRHKPHAVLRAVAWDVVVFVAIFAVVCLGWRALAADTTLEPPVSLAYPDDYPFQSIVFALAICTNTLVLAMLFVHSTYDLDLWAAAFCSTTGYALQNLSSGIAETITLLLDPGRTLLAPQQSALTAGCCCVVYLLAWRLFIRRIDARGLSGRPNVRLVLLLLVVVFGVIGFDLILKYTAVNMLPRGIVLCLRAFHALVCTFVIVAEVELVVVRQLADQRARAEHLLAESEHQYQLSRESIQAINARIHNMRRDVLRSLRDAGGSLDHSTEAAIVREIDVYDAPVRTGNEALDVVLTEKSLLCRNAGITLTCVADGPALGFVSPADLYALLGGALDGAIAAVRHIPSEELRSISLVVRRRANVVSVHVECYRDGRAPQADGLATDDMRVVVERYGGTLAHSASAHAAQLDALLPVPAA